MAGVFKKSRLFLLLLILLTPFVTTQVLAAACTDITADDANTTISADCTDLDISGDNTTTIINSGVTVSTVNSSTDDALAYTGANSGEITNNGTINSLDDYGLVIEENSIITTITNSGTISAGGDDYGLINDGTITTLNNSGTISAADDDGLINDGTITTLTNSGTISAGDNDGIDNNGTITTLTNSGTISAVDFDGIDNDGTITTLTNSGTISAGENEGIDNNGTITTLTNSGTISADYDEGIDNSGTITTLTNSGTISADDDYGIYNTDTITTLTNSGTISADYEYGIYNTDTITTLDNSGTIETLGDDEAIRNTSTGTITTLTNTGMISAWDDYGIYNEGTITSLTNSGTIRANNGKFGIGLGGSGSIDTLTNTGQITSEIGSSGGDPIPGAAIFVGSNSSINTLDNSGTIETYDGSSVINSYGTINNLVNSGTIHSDEDSAVTGGIANITNTGTISADGWKALGLGSGTLNNSGTISAGSSDALSMQGDGIVTNSGTISAAGNSGIYISSGTGATIINSGTISAGGDYGLRNYAGTINTITNTGTITANGNYGIFNERRTGGRGGDVEAYITTLNNSQGASSSALDYNGRLPTNYNIIINSNSDYGKINFSSTDLLGTTNFGIYSSSTIDDSYYSGVITGLTSSYINNDSGSNTISGTTYTWNLKNPSGTTWDLYVISDTSTNLSLTTEFAPTLRTAFNYADAMSFVHSNYDCDTFEEDWCLSIGGRGTQITNDNTSQGHPALLLGKKLNDQYRLVLFYDHNYDYFHSKNIPVKKRPPIIGGSLVWNQKDNHSGYEMKLSHAFQEQKLSLTRPKVGVSFKGTGETLMTAYDTAAEIKYNYQRNTLTLSPYGMLRYSNKNINSFTETTADYPLTYNDISDETLALLAGIKFIKPLINSVNLKGSFAVNHNIRHSIDDLSPTGLNGLQTIDLEDDYSATLPIASLGLEYSINNNQSITSTIQHRELSYQSMSETNIYVQYAFAF